MTEAEWLACEDPQKLVEVVLESPRANDRTCRLCVAAIEVRFAITLLGSPYPASIRKRIAAMEKWADNGKASKLIRDYQGLDYALVDPDPRVAIRGAAALPDELDEADGRAAVKAGVASALREVFGNPFRPVAFSPSWRTDTALSLARQMYEARDFGAMPILADALQDAGCNDEHILAHCRDPQQVHVRGCWAVDLVLGKE
jgi:hypothetical protein